MTRRSRSNGNQSRRSPGARVEKICGRQFYNASATPGSIIAVSPAAFSRALAIADVFQFYRFTKLDIHIAPTATTYSLGYANGAAFDTPPTTTGEVMQLPYAQLITSTQTVPIKLHVPRSELVKDSQLNWFKTIAGNPDTQFEIQGNIYLGAGAATTAALYVDYEVEFQSWNLATNSPLRAVPSVPVGVPSTDIPLSPGSDAPMRLYHNGAVYEMKSKI